MAKLAILRLQNYRNLKNIEIQFGGKDGKIVGANRIGKTNILESICYLLTDKLLGGSSDIQSIKPQDDPRLKVVVEGVFFTDEGEVTLRKEFYEKWVRPRGSATEELSGHSTDYYVNGAKQARAKDFYDLLEKKLGIPTELHKLDAYQLVIDPFYLGEAICGSKDWKNAREAVIEIVGDVEPEEIYTANPATRIAEPDLKAHQYDDAEAKKAIRGEIDGYKKAMIANDGLINEYGRVTDVPQEEHDAAKVKDEELVAQLGKLKAGDVNPYADEVTTLQQELFKLNEAYRQAALAPIDHTQSERIRFELTKKRDELAKAERAKRSVETDISTFEQQLTFKRSQQEAYKKQIGYLNAEMKSIAIEDTCPTCGQKLPTEKIEEAVNIKKAEITAKAASIREIAVENKKVINELEQALATLNANDFDAEIASLKAEVSDLEKAHAVAISAEAESVQKPDPKIQERIAEINSRLSQIRGFIAAGQEGVEEQISAIKAEREKLQVTFSKRLAYLNAVKRLGEIRMDNVRIGKKQADAEQRLWAVGEFVKTKLELLDEHMANKLGEVRFQLIKENIKAGSYDEVCVPYIIDPMTGKHKATLFPDGSKSEQIYTGIQIIKAIRDSNGWTPLPILFDQGGELDGRSTTKVAYDAEAQIIAVKVEGTAQEPTFLPFDN